MTNKEFKGFVRLSSDQYAELKLNGSLVIEGRTIEYSPLDTIYMITDAGNMIEVANTTEGEQNDVVLNITNNILRAQLNQTIKTKINNKQDKLTFDTTPTINSNNPVTSGGVYDALASKQDKLTAGTNITIDTNNVISASGGLQEVKASDVNSETATSGQVLTADGSGGASWQNASGGGDKSYRHLIHVYSTSTYLTIINKDRTSLSTIKLLSQALNDSGADYSLNHFMSATGFNGSNNFICSIGGVSSGASITVMGVTLNIDNGVLKATTYNLRLTNGSVYDTVTEL